MPGLIAIAADEANESLEKRLLRGANRMVRKPWHKTASLVSSRFAVAAVCREGTLPGADLWTSEDGNLVIAMDGELYGGEPATTNGERLTLDRPTSSCGPYIAALYKEHGARWVEKVRGAFAVIIIDNRKKEICLFVDRFGLRPLAYALVGRSLVVGSTMAAITASWPEHAWKLDMDAVASWFTLHHVLGERTFIEGVSLMPNASRMCFDFAAFGQSTDSYWTIEQIQPREDIAFDDAVDEANRLFDRAVREQTADGARVGVYLTSGLDSRSTAAFLARRGISFSSFTYGLTGCRDMVWGAELAKTAKSPHYPLPMDDGSWVHRHAADFVAITESFTNCYHASHGIDSYEKTREIIDIHLSGYGGGSFLGGDTTTIGALSVSSSEQRAEELYKDYIFSLGNVFRSPIELRHLFRPDLWPQIAGRAEESFSAEFHRHSHLRPDIVGDAFTLANRYKKLFAYLIAAERDYFEDRTPFMDYDLMDFVFSIPTSLRLGRQMQIGMLDKAAPAFTETPWQVTTLPATREVRKIKKHIRRRKLDKLFAFVRENSPEPFEPGRNYPKWLRESGIEWATGILDSPEVERRGLSRSYLKNLLLQAAESEKLPYPDQRNLTFRIGAVISFELMCRMIFDKLSGSGDSQQETI